MLNCKLDNLIQEAKNTSKGVLNKDSLPLILLGNTNNAPSPPILNMLDQT